MGSQDVLQIHLKAELTFSGKIDLERGQNEPDSWTFTFPVAESTPVTVELLPKQDTVTVTAIQDNEVSEAFVVFLQGYRSPGDNKDLLEAELGRITSGISRAAKGTMALLCSCLENTLSEEPLPSVRIQWSTDKSKWHRPPFRMRISIFDRMAIQLSANTATAIQQLMENRFEPFMAFRHLQRARLESLPRYKWIDATIAAELAIKEFLVRVRPELKTLLLEMPSPPLDKLYGKVLQSFGYPESPKRKEIQKGAKIRNDLIHKPDIVEVSSDDAEEYVNNIEIAIRHLVLLLYPDDTNVQRLFAIPGSSSHGEPIARHNAT
jgi:hypothetical protein